MYNDPLPESDFDIAIARYMDHIKQVYNDYIIMPTGTFSLSLSAGSKYIKVFQCPSDGGARYVHSFVVKKEFTNSKGTVFRVGDVLKAASWNTPATNFPRGIILDGTFGRVEWCGVV